MPSGRATLNSLLLIATAAAGPVLWILSSNLTGLAGGRWATSPLIGLSFFVLALGLFAIVMVVSLMTGAFEGNIITNGGGLSTLLFGLAACILIFGLGTLFQFLYSLDTARVERAASSYLFLIDSSGSMQQNDPKGKRYDAVNRVLEDRDMDFPYAVYSFTTYLEEVRSLGPKSQGAGTYTRASNGGTALLESLDELVSRVKDQDALLGDSPRVIALTDGQTSPFRLKSVAKACNDEGFSVSAVGLGDADSGLLEQLALATGGVYIYIDDISDVNEAMEQASVRNADRNLLDYRYTPNRDGWLGFLRILFLFLLGLAVRFTALLACGRNDSLGLGIPISLGAALLGAILVEALINGLMLSSGLADLLLWELLCVTVAFRTARRRSMPEQFNGNSIQDGSSSFSGGGNSII